MAQAPLLQLSGVSLTFGGDPVFDDLSLVVHPGDRVALVGRNGSGKSTLMKVMAGLVEPDTGARTVPSGVSVGYMEQDPDLSGFATLGDFAAATLDDAERYRVETVAEGLRFDPDRPVEAASGGERRRAALARLMAEAPELMLLDEPTNHLDIEAIGWLEEQLRTTRTAFVLISHDRRVLSRLTRATLWIDRGAVRRLEQGFDGFEDWREKVWEEEDQQAHKLDRRIKEEARWAVEGISARRKRNQGRLRALQDMRAERAAQIARQGTAAMAFAAGPKSGKRVVEAEGLSHGYGDKRILRDFDVRITRGERVAFVGPNGVGKTTLIRILMGEIAPDAGTVVRGTNLVPAVFDQNRARLDPDMSLWESLTGDKEMRVSGKADQVLVRGQPKHVVGYLKEFLFDERQARAPVRSLSGGEKARLLLAKIMAQESNLLVLDEPTNDLDIETLDLLQDLLDRYDGTVLLVSHDRDFIDRVATTTIAMEGGGTATVYAGGWSDYQAQKAEAAAAAAPRDAAATGRPKTGNGARGAKSGTGQGGSKAAEGSSKAAGQGGSKSTGQGGLSYKDRHRLDRLPGEIERLEKEIAKLESFLGDPDLYAREPLKFEKATEALTDRQAALAAAEEEWLELAERAEAAG